jgi:lipid-binding SYLF domain-containing protein
MGKTILQRTMLMMVVVGSALAFVAGDRLLAFADAKTDATQLAERSKITFDTFVASKDLEGVRALLKRAKGVFISPQMLEGAFVFGVSGGSGVFVTRDPNTGKWNGPAFYTVGEVSFGLQAGGQASQVLMLVMSHRGVTALLSPSVKLGTDVGVAAGPVGVGAAAATANISADIIAYALSKGLYGGISLTGAGVAVRNEWNEAYYNKPGVTPTDILIRHEAENPQSAPLLRAVAEAARESAVPAAQMTGRYYAVERGDTLYGISKKYGISVAELRRLNNLREGQHIYPGQKILIRSGN